MSLGSQNWRRLAAKLLAWAGYISAAISDNISTLSKRRLDCESDLSANLDQGRHFGLAYLSETDRKKWS